MFKQADNYLKLTVRTERTVRDYIKPFRSEFETEAVEALSDLFGIQLGLKSSLSHATFTISAFAPCPFLDMGEHIPQIGEWHPDDLPVDEPASLH